MNNRIAVINENIGSRLTLRVPVLGSWFFVLCSLARPGVKCQEAICEHLDEQSRPLLGSTNHAGAPSYTTHVCAGHFHEPAILSLREGLLVAGRRPATPPAAWCAPPFSAGAQCPASSSRPKAADQGYC